MAEKLQSSPEQGKEVDLSPEAVERHAELREQLQHNAEQHNNNPETVDNAKHEALELARSTAEEEAPQKEVITTEKTPRRTPTKRELNANFDATMAQVRTNMSPASRTFSKVIHNPVVDKVSTAAGNTVARPNLIVAGALGTLILCSAVYFIAKHYSYTLSGFEAIATFIVGWSIGAVVEFVRVGFKK